MFRFAATASVALSLVLAAPVARAEVSLIKIGSYRTGIFDKSAAEISTYDKGSKRLFVVNGAAKAIDILDLSDPTKPRKIGVVSLKAYGAGVNSVAAKNGIVAAAVESDPKQAPGKVVFFRARDGKVLGAVEVGALPDMVVFTPDGKTVLVANEGEPSADYKTDPEGSVSVIDLSKGVAGATVRTADFRAWNGKPLPAGMHNGHPKSSFAQNVEPEYIAVTPDGTTAYVSLQESNALAIVDIGSAKVVKVVGLGFKDHGRHGLDASDKDTGIHIRTWPVRGMYQPDAIAIFMAGGAPYIVTANEGDSRDYKGWSEETRVGKLKLDPKAFPNARELQKKAALGRLKTTRADGDANGDGRHETIYSYGARSFSIRSADGALIWDSGDAFERHLAKVQPKQFNANDGKNASQDSRSDDKGVEPEGVAVGTVRGRTYAFIGLERTSGLFVYDVTDPKAPKMVQYLSTRDYSGNPKKDSGGDIAPEGLLFISAADSPNGRPLLVVTFEVSGSTVVYDIR